MDEFSEWLKTRPKVIQDLGEKYPPGQYIIKQDAPYGISCPGTFVELYSYSEDGEIVVVVKAENKLQQAIEHEIALGVQHNRTKLEMDKIHASNVSVKVDPKWLEKVK